MHARLAVLLLVVAAAAPALAAPAGSAGPAQTAPADPAGDPLGWEAGYWHNESIDVDPSDGLNDTELDRVVARAMARVEHVRGLEFERRVPVEVVSRETYADRVADRYGDVSEGDRRHQDVKFEALFMLGEDESAVDEQQSTTAASVGGHYSPGEDEIVIVSENTTSPKLNEITLSQELFHALQFRHFDVGNYSMHTRETHNAADGIVEGDGNYVDYLYGQACEAEWNGDCLLPAGGGGGGGDGPAPHVGMLYLRFQPYSDGPPFVRGIYEAGGWDAVNAVYDDPPASTEQTIHPERYGTDPPTNVTVPDRSAANWSVVNTSGAVDYASFGEAGLFTMLWYPGYESQLATQIVPYTSFLNFEPGESPPEIDPFNYTSRYSAGWDGDRLVPYVADDPAENETGYVWSLAWDSSAEAAEFVEGYERLLGYHGAERVGEDTWRIPDGGFADAFHVNVTGDTVVITNAPTVATLDEVRSTVTVETGDQRTDLPATTAAPTTTTATDTTDGASAPGVPGFGVAIAALALTVAALAAWRRSG